LHKTNKRPGAAFCNESSNEKCFFLNPEKILAQIRPVVFEKNTKDAHFNSEK